MHYTFAGTRSLLYATAAEARSLRSRRPQKQREAFAREALRAVTPMSSRRIPMDLKQAKQPYGVVHIIPSRCKGCRFCIEFCPQQVLVQSENINAKGYHYPVVAEGKEEACVHCRFCDLVCPDLAIYTVDADELAQAEAAAEASA